MNLTMEGYHNDHLDGAHASTGYQVCRVLVVGLTVAGNFLLILSLIVRRGAFNFLDRLMLNSVFCNLLLVLVSIPTSLEIERSDVYPFGVVGCKLIYPMCTYLMNTCVFTYVAIACERWLVVSKMGNTQPSYAKELIVFIIIHILGLLTVVPYIPVLTIAEGTCIETWGNRWRKAYTMALFLLQYGIPVPVLVTYYAKTWLVIYRSTKEVISSMMASKRIKNKQIQLTSVSESSLLSTNVTASCETLDLLTSPWHRRFSVTLNVKNVNVITRKPTPPNRRDSSSACHMLEMKRKDSVERRNVFQTPGIIPRSTEEISEIKSIFFMKKYFQPKKTASDDISPRACAQFVAFKNRNKQTRMLLLRFTIIMLVFVVCTLPHQVLWLLIDFKYAGNEYFSQITLNLAHLVTYANCVINPLLYGQYNKKFRHNIQRVYQNLKSFIYVKS